MLAQYIESIIFSSDRPISHNDIARILEYHLELDTNNIEIQEALESLVLKYSNDEFSFELRELSGGYIFMTKSSYYPVVESKFKEENKKNLSRMALETLAIIAYRQPVTKAIIESIRGVNSDYNVNKLLERELVRIEGRADAPGKPLLYTTTLKFLDHFGLKTILDLPKLKELQSVVVQSNEEE